MLEHQQTQAVEDFGLDAVAKHNAALASTEQFPPYHDDAKGLGIYHDGYQPYDASPSYLHNPPTPRSATASEGMRTRSGRSTRGRTDSPSDTPRVSKSPSARSKKLRKSKLDSKTPKLTAPLSVLTKDLSVPLKDMDAWVHRPTSDRLAETAKRNGYVTRPMNSFMLYRSCYAERTKAWCVQNNHQVVSSVSGESWPMEPQEVRAQFEEWARIERENHARAHPEYKFSPSKSGRKRGKGDLSDDEDGDDGVNDLGVDPDGEYRGGRVTRQRRAERLASQRETETVPMNSIYGFESHPYFGGQPQQLSGYEASQYQFANPGRTLMSNVAYDSNGMMYDPQTGQYIHQAAYQHPQYAYVQDVRGVRIPTPAQQQQQQQQTVGGYGLPGGQQVASTEDIFGASAVQAAAVGSRSGTPAMHTYANSYGQPIYPQYTTPTPQQQQQHQHHQSFSMAPPYTQSTPQPALHQAHQAYAEHAAYLRAAAQPQTQIDPTLEAEFGKDGGAIQVDHFEAAMGDMVGGGDLAGFEYLDEPQNTSLVDANGVPLSWTAGEVSQA